MINTKNILSDMILAGGPPRSGTTFLAKCLNSHPNIVTAIDDHVYENWAIYYYRTRVGLVQKLRDGQVKLSDVAGLIQTSLITDEKLSGAAPSEKVASYPLTQPPVRPDGGSLAGDLKIKRHTIPLSYFKSDMSLCLKSPEISFVLPELAEALPNARFILVYRHVTEIAESMYRKGATVKVPVYTKRWLNERDESVKLLAPPGVPEKWWDLWHEVSDFKRCLIYSVSYMDAMMARLSRLAVNRYFIYNHNDLKHSAKKIFKGIAQFLSVDETGFEEAIPWIREEKTTIPPDLMREYEDFISDIDGESSYMAAESMKYQG